MWGDGGLVGRRGREGGAITVDQEEIEASFSK